MTATGRPDIIAEPVVGVPSQRESRWLIALVFIGIALRLMVLLIRADDLKTDPDAYVGIAQTVVDGNGLCVPGSDRPTAFRPPLYPLLLAGLTLTGLTLTCAAGLINLLSGAVVIIATWRVARLAALRGGWVVAATAAATLDPLLLRYSALPMTESMSAALLTVAMLQILRLCEKQSADSVRSGLQPAILAGCCFGLAGLCRPVGLMTCAAITLVLLLVAVKQTRNRTPEATVRCSAGDIDRDRFVRGVCIAVLPAVVAGLVLLPWVVRNAVQFGYFIPATTHGGYTLLLGNNPVFYREVVKAPGQPAWQGGSLDKWQQRVDSEILVNGIQATDDVAIDAWKYKRALTNIGQQPGTFLQACLLRWKRFWALRPSVTDTELPVLVAAAVTIWYAGLWLGLGRSLFCADIRRSGHIQLLWMAILSFLLLHTFYWTNARMRAPLTGVIVVLSVVGWQAIFGHLFRRDRGVTVNTDAS
ncbi:MAG: hypothetical protein GY758_01305 [Fuerstiella sp.]|jgi:hypothetical protein|nr:hypothetical protein [Fuerstiella sp.]MCP4506603.1 hypothetical protein [Fuerstiella sp.]MDG2129864.1 glycosyltransferase family 39 protein [Fuerstiella sp.]